MIGVGNEVGATACCDGGVIAKGDVKGIVGDVVMIVGDASDYIVACPKVGRWTVAAVEVEVVVGPKAAAAAAAVDVAATVAVEPEDKHTWSWGQR